MNGVRIWIVIMMLVVGLSTALAVASGGVDSRPTPAPKQKCTAVLALGQSC